MRWGKLNPELAEQIRQRVAAGEKQKALAAEFGVTPPTIWQIVHHRTRIYSDQPRPDRKSATAERVLEILRDRRQPGSPREIAERSGLTLGTVLDHLRILRRRGLIVRVGSGEDTAYRLPRPPAVFVVPTGARPRTLGLRAAWLRQHGQQVEEA